MDHRKVNPMNSTGYWAEDDLTRETPETDRLHVDLPNWQRFNEKECWDTVSVMVSDSRGITTLIRLLRND